jgi:predicted nucleic acid-binding protein
MMLLDTSGLLCFLDAGNDQHSEAKTYMLAADRRLTHNLVIAELVALGTARGLPRHIVLDFARELPKSSLIDFVFIHDELHEMAVDLLSQRRDKTWSLCDAVSFLLMKDWDMQDALTTDHHFEQAGFRRLLRP